MVKASTQLLTSLGQELSLDQRRKLWATRFRKCQTAGLPEMVAACTKRQRAVGDPANQASWKLANQHFVERAFQEMEPFLGEVEVGLELFVGPGIFFRPLAWRIPKMYGLELNSETAEYLRGRLVEDGSSNAQVVCAPAHQILKTDQPEESESEGLEPKSVDGVFSFRGDVHLPQDEWEDLIFGIRTVTKLGGVVIVGQMFLDDKPRRRKIHKGTWYRTLDEYKQALGGLFELVHLSPDTIDYDGDPCRVAVWRKIG